MRIAIDARAAAETPAGRGRYVRELLTGLAGLDVDHEFLLYAREPWPELAQAARFRWVTFQAPSLAWPVLAGHRMSSSAEVALACTSFSMTGAWRLPGAAIVWDFAPFERRLRPPHGSELERLTLRLAIRRCEALIAISETTRAELDQRFPGAGLRTAVARPAADERFSPHPHRDDEAVLRSLDVKRPYVLVAGTLEPRKNVPRTIEAFAGHEEAVREGWTLVLAGAAGWETDPILASITANPGLVRALGFVSDAELACLYRKAEVFCYLSLYEGFGIPILEAMRSGTPVLTSSTSSMPEVGGDAALYVDPYNVEAIRARLAELMADPELRRRLAAAGERRARCFDWSATAREVLAVLEGLRASRGASRT